MSTQNKKETFFEVFRFLVVGGLATLVDFIVFYLFNLVILKSLNEKINMVMSTTLGFTAGLFTNWFLQKFVYKQVTNNQMHDKVIFAKFVILSIAGYLITLLVMTLTTPLHDILILNIFDLFKFSFWKLFFKCLMTLIVLIINYFGRKYLVFKVYTHKKEEIEQKI